MVWLLLLASTLTNFELEVDYAGALRARGLHRLAEVHCRQLLEDEELTPPQRVEGFIQLSKTLAERALNSRAPKRDEYWTKSTQVISEASADTDDPASKLLLKLQLGLTKLERAEWARREAEVVASADDDWQVARTLLREAIRELKSVEETLQQPAMRSGNRGLTPNRVTELLRNTRYQLSRGYRNQAITYSVRPADSIASLNQALDRLQVLAGETASDPLVWTSRVDRIECYRLRGDLERAGKLIEQTRNPPPELLGRLAAEGVRLALAAKRPDAAMRLLENQEAGASHPDLELARIETLVRRAGETAVATDRKELQSTAAAAAAKLAEVHGNYWGLRGELLIARLADRSESSGDTDLLDNTAKTMLKRDAPEKAVEMFIRAAQQAERDGAADKAFEFRRKAGTVEHQNGNLQLAIDRFRDAANRHPDNSAAAETHLLAVFDAAALYQQHARSRQQGAEKKLQQYESLLLEHLSAWPRASTADQARIWFGRLAEAKRNALAAIEAYRGIATGSEHAAEGFRRLDAIAHSRFADPSLREELLAAREWAAQRIGAEPNSATAAVLRLHLARLLMNFSPQDYAASTRLLREVERTAAGSRQASQARALLVVATAGQSNSRQARVEFARIGSLEAASAIDALRGLQPLRDRKPNDRELQLLMGDCLRELAEDTPLSADDELLIRQCRADVAERDDALAMYADLATAHPRNIRIQRRYAEVLSAGDDVSDALEQWRIVVRRSRPRSPDWFRGKLGVAQAHFVAGEKARALELIEVLKALHPELGGPELKASFEALLRRAR